MKKNIREYIEDFELSRDIPNESLFPGSDELVTYGLPAGTKTSIAQPNGPYDESEYLNKFLGKYDGDINQSQIKEATIMGKSLLQELLEEVEIKADGKDDGELGAVQPTEGNDSIDKSLDELQDKAEALDKKLDLPAAEDALMGDVDKEAVVNESIYKVFVNRFFHNLCELSVRCQLGEEKATGDTYKVMVESFYRTVSHKEKPVLWESLSDETKNAVVLRANYFIEQREKLLAKPTIGNLTIVERYIDLTNELLSEAGLRWDAAKNYLDNLKNSGSAKPSVTNQLPVNAKNQIHNASLKVAAKQKAAEDAGKLSTKFTKMATNKTNIAGGAAIAGLGVLWLLYRLYKKRMTAKCDSLKGAEKAKCRAILFKQAATAAKAKMESSCKKAKDADKCKMKFASTIAKWEAAARSEEGKAKA